MSHYQEMLDGLSKEELFAESRRLQEENARLEELLREREKEIAQLKLAKESAGP